MMTFTKEISSFTSLLAYTVLNTHVECKIAFNGLNN